MGKKILVGIIILFAVVVAFIVAAITFSFTYLKKNTDNIIKIQRDKLTTIINIPNAVPPSNPTFDSITYTWEMETTQNEVTGVNITQTTGFTKSKDSILIVLERTAGGDASIFDRVLPAVIADEEVLKAAFSSEKVTQLKDGKTGFRVATIERDASDKVVKITWEFEKNNFGKNIDTEYKKLQSLPEPTIISLYVIQSVAIAALSGQ